MPKKSLTFNSGDIVLIEFPFSDYSGLKIRPVLVLSNSDFNNNQNDIIVCKITSSNFNDKYQIVISNQDLENGNLKLERSWIGTNYILTIDKSLVSRKIAKLSKNKFEEVQNSIKSIFSFQR